jgi:hypothetical protein
MSAPVAVSATAGSANLLHSETARRLTNLFSDPKPVEHVRVFLEEGLIHRTSRGELVRSKSEVIIANLLHTLGITYAYEQSFTGQDGSVRYPDFTIEDAETRHRLRRHGSSCYSM